jgi:hypothetical protein
MYHISYLEMKVLLIINQSCRQVEKKEYEVKLL